jgi:hypothetical protein
MRELRDLLKTLREEIKPGDRNLKITASYRAADPIKDEKDPPGELKIVASLYVPEKQDVLHWSAVVTDPLIDNGGNVRGWLVEEARQDIAAKLKEAGLS